MDFVFNFAKNNLKDFTMKAIDIIKARQLEWAKRKGLGLKEKYPLYCKCIDCNIYGGLNEEVRKQFENGNGNELKDGRWPAKMKALFSSSALCVNLFQYFTEKKERDNVNMLELLHALNLVDVNNNSEKISIQFEEKFKTGISTPNIDLTIRIGEKKLLAFESKFTEPYNSSHRSSSNYLTESYYKNEKIWKNVEKLYKKLEFNRKKEEDKTFENENTGEKEDAKAKKNFSYSYLDGAQLVKHILGIKNTLVDNKDDSKVTLVYLWYDTFGEEGTKHRKEIDKFCNFINDSLDYRIEVKHITYQEVIYQLCKIGGLHRDYLNYITERYL